MIKYTKLREDLFLIVFDITQKSENTKIFLNYQSLDSFLIDYKNKEIKNAYAEEFEADYAYILSHNLLGNEEYISLDESDYLRPTKKEPLIRGLYAAIYRNEKDSYIVNEVLNLLGDIRLNSLNSEFLIPLAKDCVFSTKERLTWGGRKESEKLIPEGSYCYSNKVCPHWSLNEKQDTQNNGFCSFLNVGDWEVDGVSLLWDKVKECGINNDD